MGGKFSSGCAATYIFVLRPNLDTSSNSDVKSESYRFSKSSKDRDEAFNLEEDMESMHQCMRDIDAYVHQLRSAIEQMHSLERNKRRSKKQLVRVPLMPSELDMLNIFKRIKLAINYIARLKYHLYQPNAPEMIHVVFAHLMTLVNICQKYPTYGRNLPSRVVLPLLGRDAVRFLRSCLVSREMDLWKSLGKAWTLPRDEWKGEGSLCNAVLLEGWEACYPPNGRVVHNRPCSSSRSRHRSGTTETDFSEEGPSPRTLSQIS